MVTRARALSAELRYCRSIIDQREIPVTSTIATDGNGRWVEYAGGYTDMLAQRAAESRGELLTLARRYERRADYLLSKYAAHDRG